MADPTNGNGTSRRVTIILAILCGIYTGWLSWVSIGSLKLRDGVNALKLRNQTEGFTRQNGAQLEARMLALIAEMPPASVDEAFARVDNRITIMEAGNERTRRILRELELEFERNKHQ